MKSIQLFEKNRNKQKSKLIIKIVLSLVIIVGFILIAEYFYTTQISKADKISEIADENKPLLTLTVCKDSNISVEITELLNDWEYEDSQSKRNVIIKDNAQDVLDCDIYLARNISSDSRYTPIWTTVYIPITRFDSSLNELSTIDNELENLVLTKEMGQYNMIWHSDANQLMQDKFGTLPSSESEKTGTEIEDIKDQLTNNKNTVAVVPFEYAENLYKILPIDSKSPTHKEFTKESYEFSDTLWIRGENSEIVAELTSEIKDSMEQSENYISENITDILMTGASAVGARGQQQVMAAQNDNAYPIAKISNYLSKADISHISNESPFMESCIQYPTSALFCGTLESTDMLIDSGIDIVGLTGNHILDYNHAVFENTLTIYDREGIEYFGGGNDFESAQEPLIIELGNQKVAFLGYNFVGPSTYYATDFKSGNAVPDQYYGDGRWMREAITKAKEEADFIIVDMQWGDPFSHEQTQIQETYGRVAIESGADIVNGVHSNFVQGIEHYQNSVIFYGLGSMLFDESRYPEAKEGFMVRHIFYEDKYIGYETVPTLINEELQTEIADSGAKNSIFEKIFTNSYFNQN